MARYYATTNNSNWGMFYDVTEGSYNINNNTSPVYVKVYLYRPSSASYYGGTANISFTCNGETKSTSAYPSYPTNIGVGESNAHLMASFSYTVTHNSDGSKTVSFSLSWSADFSPTSASGSGSMKLTTIPRASTITATSVYIGETSQLTVSRKSSNFTHTIYYSFGSLSGYILADGTTTSTATKITATSIGFPIPTSWFAEIPNAKQGTCTLTIKTYNGNTQIGSNQTTTFIARVDEASSSPIVTSSVEDINQDTLTLTNNSNILIKGYSTAEVSWSATAQNSSTISDIKINETTVTTSPYQFTLNDSFINVIATDSRGFNTTSNPTFVLKDYNAPLFTLTAERVAPTSDYAYITFSGSWFNDTFGNVQNSLTLYWKYKKTTDSTWTDGGTLVENTDYKINGNTFYSGTSTSASQLQIGGNLDYNFAWDIIIYAEDELVTYSISQTITQGIPIINWGEDYFNVNGEIKQFNNPIVENGSNYNGNYIKYYDGTMICTKKVTFSNVAITRTWGNFYESTVLSIGDYAEPFISTPTISLTSLYPNFVEKYGNSSATSWGDFYACKPRSATENVAVDCFAIGRWK